MFRFPLLPHLIQLISCGFRPRLAVFRYRPRGGPWLGSGDVSRRTPGPVDNSRPGPCRPWGARVVVVARGRPWGRGPPRALGIGCAGSAAIGGGSRRSPAGPGGAGGPQHRHRRGAGAASADRRWNGASNRGGSRIQGSLPDPGRPGSGSRGGARLAPGSGALGGPGGGRGAVGRGGRRSGPGWYPGRWWSGESAGRRTTLPPPPCPPAPPPGPEPGHRGRSLAITRNRPYKGPCDRGISPSPGAFRVGGGTGPGPRNRAGHVGGTGRAGRGTIVAGPA
jgi:hypothetical protein